MLAFALQELIDESFSVTAIIGRRLAAHDVSLTRKVAYSLRSSFGKLKTCPLPLDRQIAILKTLRSLLDRYAGV